MTKQERLFRTAASRAGVDVSKGIDARITAADLARICGQSPSTTQRAVLKGSIKARRRVRNGTWMIDLVDAMAYFEGGVV